MTNLIQHTFRIRAKPTQPVKPMHSSLPESKTAGLTPLNKIKKKPKLNRKQQKL